MNDKQESSVSIHKVPELLYRYKQRLDDDEEEDVCPIDLFINRQQEKLSRRNKKDSKRKLRRVIIKIQQWKIVHTGRFWYKWTKSNKHYHSLNLYLILIINSYIFICLVRLKKRAVIKIKVQAVQEICGKHLADPVYEEAATEIMILEETQPLTTLATIAKRVILLNIFFRILFENPKKPGLSKNEDADFNFVDDSESRLYR